jgi:hypothetical protein
VREDAGAGWWRQELVELPRCQTASLAQLAHRPWPLPHGPWVMGQSWCDLLFAHWAVDPGVLEPFVPAPLRLELHGGSAWLGITPFVLRGLHARFAPPVPPASSFCELNVRTYVAYDGKPGILFLTLDASSASAVAGGRLLAALPYRKARMSCHRRGDCSEYFSARDGFRLRARWSPHGPAFCPPGGSLEHFLIERYCLYTTRRARLSRIEIHHGPWTVSAAAQDAEVEVALSSPRIPLTGSPMLHVARRQDVLVWAPETVGRVR